MYFRPVETRVALYDTHDLIHSGAVFAWIPFKN